MFNNKFNSTKKDPLVEAVQSAMQDGEIRRQAVAYVNETFGVYNRNAVVREQLAAYDAAIEEAYKCMKEGKPNDGNLANNYPPYDKVTRGDVIAGRLGKDQMGGKKKVQEEEQIDELYGKGSLSKISGHHEKESDRAYDKLSKSKGQTKRNAYEKKAEHHSYQAARAMDLMGKKKKMEEEHLDEISVGKAYSYSAGKVEKARKGLLPGDLNPSSKLDLKNMRNAAARTEKDYYKKRGFKRVDEEQIDEAAYSAKAARAGKDIGKPGKEFSKIAAKAGKKYGSEERGKKVAGAILSKIRAKHMKEDINE